MKNLSKSVMFLLLVVSLLSFNKSEAFYIGAGPVGFGFDIGRPYYDDYYYNDYYDGGYYGRPYYSRPYGYGYYGHRHHPRYHRVSGTYH